MKTLIDTRLAEITKIIRSGLSFENYLDDHSSLIANTEKNQTALINAGLDSTKIPYFRGCLANLASAIANRSGIDPVAEEKRLVYEANAKEVLTYKTELLIVGRSIAKNCGNKIIGQKIKHIMKGSGDIDNALDILGLVPILKKYPALAARIRPAGKLLDETYCQNAVEKATELLQLKGYVIVNGVPQNTGSDYIAKLITLCIQNQREIKEFAEAAFYNNPDFYNDNFTCKYKKAFSSDDIDDIDTEDHPSGTPIDAITVTSDLATAAK